MGPRPAALGSGVARGTAWVNLLPLAVGLRQRHLLPVPLWVWLRSVILLGVIGSMDVFYRAAQESGDTSGRNAPRHWKLGVLYYNPEDPRMLVPRRRGWGETLNFAHKGAWLFLCALFLPPLVVLLLILVLARAGAIPVP